MADRSHTPMSAGQWRSALRALRLVCAGACAAQEADCLRRLHELLLIAPITARLDGLRLPDPARLERMLAARACDSAALLMLAEGSGYIVSTSGEGDFLATVALPGHPREQHAPGATLALALTGALADAALGASEAEMARSFGAIPLSLH